MVFLSDISKDDINKLETVSFKGTITAISNPEDIPEAVKTLKKHRVIGFDTETKPSFRKGRVHKLALLQLAIPEEVFIFRLQRTGIPAELVNLFENENIIKAGVAIRDDLKKLRELAKFKPAGFLELQEYSNYFNIEGNSLKKLAAIVMGIKISKSQQLTNWEASELSDQQLFYAATDAWVCLEIYLRLRNTKQIA